MPDSKHLPCIINLDDNKGLGTHWVACYPSKDFKILYYFDSFGMPYPEEYKFRATRDDVKVCYDIHHYQNL